MDKNELIRRIDGISYDRISDMDEFSVKMLTDDFKTAHPDVPWLSIANMRNFLVHEYFQVDNDTVWSVIHGDIIDLRKNVVRYLTETSWEE